MSPQGIFSIAEAHGEEGSHRLPRRSETRLPSSAPSPSWRMCGSFPPASSPGSPTDALRTSAAHPAREAAGRFGTAQHRTWGPSPQHCHRTIVRRSTHRARSVPGASRAHSTTGAPSPSSTPRHPTVPTCTPGTTGTPFCWQGAPVRRRWALEDPEEQGFAPQGWACTGFGVWRGPHPRWASGGRAGGGSSG